MRENFSDHPIVSILTGIFLFSFSTNVLATPTADFTASTQIACLGQNVTFTSTSTGTIISV
ncbi:MAG: hypothetical protein U0X76_08975 [Bacteroidia bacterium]